MQMTQPALRQRMAASVVTLLRSPLIGCTLDSSNEKLGDPEARVHRRSVLERIRVRPEFRKYFPWTWAAGQWLFSPGPLTSTVMLAAAVKYSVRADFLCQTIGLALLQPIHILWFGCSGLLRLLIASSAFGILTCIAGRPGDPRTVIAGAVIVGCITGHLLLDLRSKTSNPFSSSILVLFTTTGIVLWSLYQWAEPNLPQWRCGSFDWEVAKWWSEHGVPVTEQDMRRSNLPLEVRHWLIKAYWGWRNLDRRILLPIILVCLNSALGRGFSKGQGVPSRDNVQLPA